MKTFYLTEEERSVLMEGYAGLKFKNFKSSDDRLSWDMDYAKIDGSMSQITEAISLLLAKVGYDEAVGLRYNRFNAEQYVDLHCDTAFPGYDTLIIQLTGHERFSYRHGRQFAVPQGDLLLLSEGEYHSVMESTQPYSERISIVGWIRKKSDLGRISLGRRVGAWSKLLNVAIDVANRLGREVQFEFQELTIIVDGTSSKNTTVEEVHAMHNKTKSHYVHLTKNGVITCKT